MKTAFRLLMSIAALAVMSTGAAAQEQVTFTKDVAPILQEHCQVCHHVGTVAPMSYGVLAGCIAYTSEN